MQDRIQTSIQNRSKFMQKEVQHHPWEGPGATWGVAWGGLGSQVAPGFDFGAILEPKWLQKGGPGGSQTVNNH